MIKKTKMALYGKKTELNNERERRNKKNTPLPSRALVTIVSECTTIKGVLRVGSDVRIDGIVKGDVYSDKKVIIGDRGFVLGNVYCDVLELNGRMEGEVFSKSLTKMNAASSLKGNINAPSFSIEMGAEFIGMSKGKTKENKVEKNIESSFNNPVNNTVNTPRSSSVTKPVGKITLKGVF